MLKNTCYAGQRIFGKDPLHSEKIGNFTLLVYNSDSFHAYKETHVVFSLLIIQSFISKCVFSV